jgi:hypothetical protein
VLVAREQLEQRGHEWWLCGEGYGDVAAHTGGYFRASSRTLSSYAVMSFLSEGGRTAHGVSRQKGRFSPSSKARTAVGREVRTEDAATREGQRWERRGVRTCRRCMHPPALGR